MISKHGDEDLRDYTADSRMLLLSGLAVFAGAAGAGLSWVLYRLIMLSTNVFYYGRISVRFAEPAGNTLGWKALFVPVIGASIVALIARFGSDRIRGHGMPEAIESVLMGGAKVAPKLTILKPVATAIAIGSGGPFGAEGPIIMTGGAAGSLLSQMFKMSDAERSTMLVAGAAAGMSATFLAPLSAVLLAVELLLFEWRPRSLVPVAIASVTAAALRRLLLGPGPVFHMALTTVTIPEKTMPEALLVGVLAGIFAMLLSKCLYFFEDLFEKLPFHWMWWPPIGGLAIGLGGLAFPQALGIGYGVIQQLLDGQYTWGIILGVLLVKSFIWTFSLASGTSGGILAPLLMIGGGLGAALGHFMPGTLPPGAWPMICMAAVLAGAIGVPLTASMLVVELTHNSGLLLPVLLASVASYGISVLIQKRSILTERLSRRGFHLSREYSVDPMELMTVKEVMQTSLYALPVSATRKDAVDWYRSMNDRGSKAWSHWQRLFPLVQPDGRLAGVLTRNRMVELAQEDSPEKENETLLSRSEQEPVCVSTNETLRSAVDTMAESGLTVLPVVRESDGVVQGMMQIADLLLASKKASRRELDRERVIHLRSPFRRRPGTLVSTTSEGSLTGEAHAQVKDNPLTAGAAFGVSSLDGSRPAEKASRQRTGQGDKTALNQMEETDVQQ